MSVELEIECQSMTLKQLCDLRDKQILERKEIINGDFSDERTTLLVNVNVTIAEISTLIYDKENA